MTFDPVKAFVDSKRAFADARGTAQGGGGTGYYPLTTTLDAYVFAHDFFDANAKSEDGILERGAQALATAYGAGPTSSYQNAVDAWKKTWPTWLEAASKPQSAYWNNLAFWDAANRFAIARSAVGSVPGHWGMLVDSVKESAGDLITKILPRIDWKKWAFYGVLGYVGYTVVTERSKKLGRG